MISIDLIASNQAVNGLVVFVATSCYIGWERVGTRLYKVPHGSDPLTLIAVPQGL